MLTKKQRGQSEIIDSGSIDRVNDRAQATPTYDLVGRAHALGEVLSVQVRGTCCPAACQVNSGFRL